MADMFVAEREATAKEIEQKLNWMKEVIAQLDSGLISYTEMTTHLIEGSYFINSKCATLGAMAMHWKVG